uniref:Cadherin domain-containing protein n=1 Tax=Macrostomum lignano TaxID=282301 RepID=A0A1I8F7J2_9PLAT
MHCPNLRGSAASPSTCGSENFDGKPGHRHPVGARHPDKNDNAPTFAPPARAPLEVTENVNDQTTAAAAADRPGRRPQRGHPHSKSRPGSKVDRLSRADTAQPQHAGRSGAGLMRNLTRGYNITLEACDRASPTALQHHHCAVLDVNDNLPEVQPARSTASEPVSDSPLQIWPAVLRRPLKATDGADDGENGRWCTPLFLPGGEGLSTSALMAICFLVGPLNARRPGPGSPSTSAASRTARTPFERHRGCRLQRPGRGGVPSGENVSRRQRRFAVLRVSDGDLGDNGRVDCRLAEGGDRFVIGCSRLPASARDLRAGTPRAVQIARHRRRLTDRRVLGPRRAQGAPSTRPSPLTSRTSTSTRREFPDMIVYDRQDLPSSCENEFVAKTSGPTAAIRHTIRTLAPLDREAMTSFEGASASLRPDDRSLRRPAHQQHPAGPSQARLTSTRPLAEPTSPPFIPIGQLAYTDPTSRTPTTHLDQLPAAQDSAQSRVAPGLNSSTFDSWEPGRPSLAPVWRGPRPGGGASSQALADSVVTAADGWPLRNVAAPAGASETHRHRHRPAARPQRRQCPARISAARTEPD